MFGGAPPVGGLYSGMVPGPQAPAYIGFYPDAGAGPSSFFRLGTKHSLNTLTNLLRNICWFTFICYTDFVSSTFVPDN